MNEINKKLKVAALENGTVIDHIPSDKLFKVVEILNLSKIDKSITIGNNLNSKTIGEKGIIKIADTFFEDEDINKIAIIASTAKINIIRNYQVTEKYNVELPNKIDAIIKCNNPKCITNNEPMSTRFYTQKGETITVKCKYCEQVVEQSNIKLN